MDIKQECKEAIKELNLYCETNEIKYYLKAIERLEKNKPMKDRKKSIDNSKKNMVELHIR